MARQCLICKKNLSFISPGILVRDGRVCADCIEKAGLSASDAAIMTSAEISAVINGVEPPKEIKIDPEKSRQDTSTRDLNKNSAQNINQPNSRAEKRSVKPKPAKTPKQEYADVYKEKLALMNSHQATTLGSLVFDDQDKKVMIKKSFGQPYMIYDYSDLVSFHRNTVYKNVSKHHRITRGAVGGALFGGAGAVVGAMTGGKDYRAVKKMSVSVYFKNGPEFEQKYVQFETKEDSWSYRTASSSASQLEGHLRFIINQNATPVQVVAAPDSRQQPQPENESKVENDTSDKESFDQLRELKKLLDEGVITQDDFDSKKKKILGI